MFALRLASYFSPKALSSYPEVDSLSAPVAARPASLQHLYHRPQAQPAWFDFHFQSLT